MSISNIVDLNITIANPVITRAGFGTALILSAEAVGKFSGASKLYTSLTGLAEDGFSPSGATYIIASKLLAQNPRPSVFKVGKRTLSGNFTQTVELTVEPGDVADIYNVRVDSVDFEYVRPDGYTDAQVATALGDLLEADANFTVTVNAETITMTADNAGFLASFSNITRLSIADVTAVSSPNTLLDLAAIVNYDADFYGLLLDVNQKDQVETVATWTEGVRRILFFEANDSDTLDLGVTDDIFSVLKASSSANSLGLYYGAIGTGAVAGWAGKGLTYEPGAYNWAHKVITAVPVSVLSDSATATLRTKRGNYYISVAGSGDTWNGITGSGEFVDTVSLVHFLYARISEDVVAALKASVKIPYTDSGIAQITSVILARLLSKVGTGLSGTPSPVVSAPRVISIPAADKQARHVPNITFKALLDGAINSVSINGTLSVDETIFN